MAVKSDELTIVINKFTGIDRSRPGATADLQSAYMAENMDTSSGSLAVCKGCSKYIPAPVPGSDAITRLMRLRFSDGSFTVFAAAGNTIYMYDTSADPPAWTAVKTYSGGVTGGRWDYVNARMTVNAVQKPALIVANGEYPPVKIIDGAASNLGTSLPNYNYLTLNCGRLFASGVADAPETLYYSKANDYASYAEDSTGTGGGQLKIGEDAQSIRALATANGGVMIIRDQNMYRVAGTDSTNFINRAVSGNIDVMPHTAFVKYQDGGFMLTSRGLMYYNGQNVGIAKDNEKVRELIQSSDVSNTRGCATIDRLYYTLTLSDGREALLVYDIIKGDFMLRTGISVTDLFSENNAVYFIGSGRYVYKLDSGFTWDGAPVSAYWLTHSTDFGARGCEKCFHTLYLLAEGETGAAVRIKAITEKSEFETCRLAGPYGSPRCYRPRIKGSGRRMQLKFFNEAGKRFTIKDGIQLTIELSED